MKTLLQKILKRPPSTTAVTMYTRAGRGCCDQAAATLRAAGKRHRFTLEYVDVDSLPDLKTLYGSHVPVILVNGKVRFRGKVNPVLLERLLVAESRA